MVVELTWQADVAIITLNNPPLNVTSTKLRAGLLQAIAETQQKNARAVILYGQGRCFIAGGDITEFDGNPTPTLPDIIDAIHNSPACWIAAIHGMAFGGGLEIALACDFRLAHQDALFAMPEVNLGLIPGAGGTQLLPRLMGQKAAAEFCMDGKPKPAKSMQELGVIDAIFDGAADLAGLEFIEKNQPLLPPTPIAERPCVAEDLKPLHDALQKKTTPQAPYHILQAIGWASEYDYAEGQKRERELHLNLRASAESNAYRHVFFAEKSTAKPEKLASLKPRNIDNVAVLGGGLMGVGIAVACLLAGKKVTLLEQDADSTRQAHARIEAILRDSDKRGKLNMPLEQSLQALHCTHDMAQLANHQLVIEAIFEDLTAKQNLFQQLDSFLSDDTIITTNTSYLNPAEILPAHRHGKAAGMHFFSPAYVMKLVELVALPQTEPQVLADIFAFARQLKKQPVETGICDGFIGNRILMAYRRQADYLLADGAQPAEIDSAMRQFGMPKGPYELQDMSGLQIAWAQRQKQKQPQEKTNSRYIPFADFLCEAGHFGKKTGCGWYRYDEAGKAQTNEALQQQILDYAKAHTITRQEFSVQDIQIRCLAVMVNEGALIVEQGIAASPEQVDIVKIAGYGFPRWLGGPLYYAKAHLPELQQAMAQVARQSPDAWKISTMLRGE